MINEVGFRPVAEDQLATLPKDGLLAYLPAHVALAVDPWGGEPHGRQPGGNMRQRFFGTGMVIYLIVERDGDRKVWVLEIVWAG